MSRPAGLPKKIHWPIWNPDAGENGEWEAPTGVDPVSGNPIKHVLGEDQVHAIRRITAELLGKEEDGYTHSALLGAEMGSGKTVIVVETILNVWRDRLPMPRILIVGPRDVGKQWFETIEAQTDFWLSRQNGALRIIDTKQAGAQNLTDLMSGTVPGVYYMGLDLLRARGAEGRYKTMPELDLIVTDEAHRHSSRSSVGAKIMRQIPAARKLALSGTFFANKFENAHTITRWLWPEVRREDGYWLIEPSIQSWLAKWARAELARSKSGRVVKNPKTRQPIVKIIGEKNPGEFVQTLPCYVFLKSPVGDPPEPERIVVRMSGVQESQYQGMETRSLSWLVSETGTLEPLVADLPIVQRIRLRTAALGEMRLLPGDNLDTADTIEFAPGSKSNKLNALGNLLLEHPDWKGERVLILTHSKTFGDEIVRRIERKFPGQVAQKSGDTKEREWDEAKARFMEPMRYDGTDLLYLVATHQAVGTGTDGLQEECCRDVVLSRDENNTNNMQSRQRIWRRGVDMKNYKSVEFLSHNSIDMEIETRTDIHRKRTLASIRGGHQA